MNKRCINFVCGPRNISTAIMYSFAQRNDTQVVDEPWYASYLLNATTDHPAKEEIMASQSSDPLLVWEQLAARQEKPVLFIKNMAHHMHLLPSHFWQDYQNVFLIRDPHDLITSFAKVIPQPQMRDIGVQAEWELYEMIKNDFAQNPIVIDSGELLKAPRQVMKELCDRLDLDFQEAMMSWEKGGRREDGIWAKHWYTNVHDSTGFAPQRKTSRPMPVHCQDLYEAALPYYTQLFEKSIKAQ